MSKTFKSTMTDSRELEVDVIFSNPRLLIKESGNGRSGFVFAPADAPALALAILEAAGYGEEVVTDGSPDGHIQVAKYYLYEGVKAHASITAEARERAELEAEALELANAAVIECGNPPYPSVERMGEKVLRRWLAVARRARELAKEATK